MSGEAQQNDTAIKKVAANLRRIRDARGLTQEKLADLSDVHHRTIQKVEGGEMFVRLPTLFHIRSVLKCSWEDLLGR